jgi:hypothetical protein
MRTGNLWYFEVCEDPKPQETECASLPYSTRSSLCKVGTSGGFLGGAVATHVRVGDPFWIPLLLGIVAWVGLFLRDARLRALLPLRR